MIRFLDWLRILPCSRCSRTGPCGVYLVTAGEAIALCQACNGLGEAEAAQDEGEEIGNSGRLAHEVYLAPFTHR